MSKAVKNIGSVGEIKIKPENKIDRKDLNPPTKSGNAPTFKKDGKSVEIHHEGQNPKGPFKEMHPNQHRGKGNDAVNHPNKNKPSQIDRKEFNKAKKEYWKKEYENK
ncbi:MAG: HNH/ENDO VII family nuclease [Bacteroidia bacterium]|nr:HNH/ENDO VII family nuclease [Bacteroidia bacterium]